MRKARMWWWSVKLGGPFLPEEAGACLDLSRKELVSFVSGSLDLSRSDGRSRVVRLQTVSGAQTVVEAGGAAGSSLLQGMALPTSIPAAEGDRWGKCSFYRSGCNSQAMKEGL